VIKLQGRSRLRARCAPADTPSVGDSWLSCCCGELFDSIHVISY